MSARDELIDNPIIPHNEFIQESILNSYSFIRPHNIYSLCDKVGKSHWDYSLTYNPFITFYYFCLPFLYCKKFPGYTMIFPQYFVSTLLKELDMEHKKILKLKAEYIIKKK